MASDRDKRMQTALELRQRLERYGNVAFRTHVSASSLPPPAAAPARSMATSGIGVSMQTPTPGIKSQRGLIAAGLVIVGGGFLAVRGLSHLGSAAAASSGVSTDAPSGVTAEPQSPHSAAASSAVVPPVAPAPPEAPPPVAIATEKAQPPAAPSAAHSAAAAVHSAPVPVAPMPAKPGRSDERGLAKDNPFK
jgi:hypothetical protein